MEMTRTKRMISVILLLCMVVTMLPPLSEVEAAGGRYRYELVTAAVDKNATYLVVSTNAVGEANCLMFDASGSFQNQKVTIEQDNDGIYIADFEGAEECLFTFSGSSSANMKHGDYFVDVQNQRFTTSSYKVSISRSSGRYRIKANPGTKNLRFSSYDGKWDSVTTVNYVYLFKQVETVSEYTVSYDGNGHTAGTVPAAREGLAPGSQYTIAEPENLRKDVGMDTYLFKCWNTAADGSGTEYLPGAEITVDGDLKLYAQWYQQAKYEVAMMTYLDNQLTDVSKISGLDKQFFVVLEGGDGTYIPLSRTAEGTYITGVTQNGTYVVYSKVDGSDYEPVHGHQVVVYNQNGSTECMHYSVNYDVAGGTWASGEAPEAEYYHFGEAATAYDKTPTLAGNRFLHWQDQNGNIYTPSQLITSNIKEKMTLTAVWEETIDITIKVTIDHGSDDGGVNNADDRNDVILQLLREENGANLPVDQIELTSEDDPENNTTTYTVVLKDQQQGIYRISGEKKGYETTVTYKTENNGDQEITVNLEYAPDNFDLVFDVKVNADQSEETLMPLAVNVKVSYWGYDKNNVLGWHIITQQADPNTPTTVVIDENGNGSGFYSVWRNWAGISETYLYRVEVTSFVMPDGSVVRATGNQVVYTGDSTGLYKATIEVTNGIVPEYPEGSNTKTELSGAYFDGEKQVGAISVVVDINPYTVTFDAEEGLVNGQESITLTNQYRYPSLLDYVAVPNEADKLFICWTDAQGNPVEDMSGQLLTGNVTYYARYNANFTLSGTVSADATYERDGQQVTVWENDRVYEAMVVLQKQVGEVFNDVSACVVKLVYENVDGQLKGVGQYKFDDVPNDDVVYRIQILSLNYNSRYDSNLDGNFGAEEYLITAQPEVENAQVNVQMVFAPDQYQQQILVDTTLIHPDFRPTGATAQIVYRDLDNTHPYEVISQHTADPYGVQIAIDPTSGEGAGYDYIWNWHTAGGVYEYQAHAFKFYGNNVEGAYMQDGTLYDEDRPFTVQYGPANNYLRQEAQQGAPLEMTLIPNEYPVILDLNLDGDPYAVVYGLEEFLVESTGKETYAFMHTWSYTQQFNAYPYREGYVFKGWKSDSDDVYMLEDGTIYVGNTLAKSVTLTAQWEEATGTDYTIRHLELNTDKVLSGAQVIRGAAWGQKIVAADAVAKIDGYVYAGAAVGGEYYHKADNPHMYISDDPTENVMVIYYLPDGSDGYTEQVESNLTADKTAILEDNGTYTITLEAYTKDNPITTLIQQNTPMDIVMVMDQSGSIKAGGYLDEIQESAKNFVELIAAHGKANEVDHRIGIVGYADDGASYWLNTGVFDSSGQFHKYSVTGFDYTEHTGPVDPDGTYYTYDNGKYQLLTYYETYYHLITEEKARQELVSGNQIFGYVDGQFIQLTRNTSGLWLYGDKQLYSNTQFFTYHEQVWTHRDGIEPREIHGYMDDNGIISEAGHGGIYTRKESTATNPDQSIYQEALVPVSNGVDGSGRVNPGLINATQNLASGGETFIQYGIELGNRIFAANPLDTEEGRIRVMVMFTDGMPGDHTFFNEEEANAAIAQAYVTKNTHGAYVYTIGLYPSAGVTASDNRSFFMHAVSSNYPKAKSMDDAWVEAEYVPVAQGSVFHACYYVKVGDTYYTLTRKQSYSNGTYMFNWGYESPTGRVIVASCPMNQSILVGANGMVGDYVIYDKVGYEYKATANSGYYATTDNEYALKSYFAHVVEEITTKITQDIILHEDTIFRDVMGQGLRLVPGTKITAYKIPGVYNETDGSITWQNTREQVAQVIVGDNSADVIYSKEVTSIDYVQEDGSVVTKENVPYLTVYNLQSANATNPDGSGYHPHTVDITGYDFENWYISDKHTAGFKMEVTIEQVEATDDVRWGRASYTNHETSGIWLPQDANGQREMLLAFKQPTTVFVERTYVLDYGKEFALAGWYFDDEEGQQADAIHVDCNIENGMNWFDPENPNTTNQLTVADGQIDYGNTQYGNVQVKNGQVTYSPVTMNWGGYDQFFVFGNTWRKTVLAQDANENGNLWNKVTVIPANNIYYEDSFCTTEERSATQNAISGFTFTGSWSTVNSGNVGENVEIPEHQESNPYGDVHGWTDSLEDDLTFTDGQSHFTNAMGASVEFTFTGTGVDVYTVTNAQSGMIVAMLKRHQDNGSVQMVKSIAVDNLAVSGEYYHIPTVSFMDLTYGTYTVQLIATKASASVDYDRYEYYLDGVRIYNPLGSTTNYAGDVVKDAYGLENNAVFTEVRDILLDYKDFNVNLPDGQDGKMGAVFIDWIQEGQGTGSDSVGEGVPSYEIGTFETYGPKNEVYLSAGQAIVLKVDEANTYYLGMKSLTGDKVTVNVSGITGDPTTIELSHTTDMYYQIKPVDGYIVIQNGNQDEAILSITKLRTTNLYQVVENGGVELVAAQEAVDMMTRFTKLMRERPQQEPEQVQPEVPEETRPSPQQQAEANLLFAKQLLEAVRKWMQNEKGGELA